MFILTKLRQLFAVRSPKPQVAATAKPTSPAQSGSARADAAQSVRGLYLEMLLQSDALDSTELSVPEKLVGQMVEQALRNVDQRGASVPRLPMVIPLLLKQLRDPNASIREYVTIIKQEPVVAQTVLQVANSVYFNPYRKPLRTFEQAVSVLGIHGLRQVLATAVLQPIIHGGDPLPQQIWEHALACSACCQALAQREGVDPFNAYLTGLVQGIGAVTIYNLVQQSSRDYLNGGRASPALMAQLLTRWAASLTYWIAQDWQLPSDIVRALGAAAEPDSNGTALAQILQRAQVLCQAYMTQRAGRTDAMATLRLATALHCPPAVLETIDTVFMTALDGMQ